MTARKTVNEISGQKSRSKAKLKAVDENARIGKWKMHFEDLLGKPSTITKKPHTKINRTRTRHQEFSI